MKQLLPIPILLLALSLPASAQFGKTIAFKAASVKVAAAGGGGGSITINQVWNAQDTTGAKFKDVTVAPTTGHPLIAVGIFTGGGSTKNYVYSNPGGGAFTTNGWIMVTNVSSAGPDTMTQTVWFNPSAQSGITTVRATNELGNLYPLCFVYDVSGITTFAQSEASAVDTTAVGSTFTSATITTATANSLGFCALDSNASGTVAFTANQTGSVGTWSFFNANSTNVNTSGNCGGVATIIVSSTGSYKQAILATGTGSPTAMSIVFFH